MAENVDDLIQAVEEAFYPVPIENTNFMFLSLMKAIEAPLKVRGRNQYKLAHMQKYKLLKAGQLPVSITCSNDAVQCASEILNT